MPDEGSNTDGGSTPVVGDNGSVATTIPAANQGGPEPFDNSAFLESLPEAHREKPWAKEFKDQEGFIKSFEDTKAALSRRPAGIPDANATDEVKAAYHKARGVPESADLYELEALPEGYEPTEADTKFRSDIKQIFHKANLDPAQAKSVENAWNILVGEVNEAQAAAKGKLDSEFNTLISEIYGDTGDAVLASNKALITKHSDPRFAEHIGSLDNKTLMVLSTAIDGIKKEYIGEDDLPGGETPAPLGAKTNDEIRAEMAKIMSSPEFSDPTHQGHTKAVDAKDALVKLIKH